MMNADTDGTRQAGGPVALGAVSLDLQRLTVDELGRLAQALQAEVKRRHAELQRTNGLSQESAGFGYGGAGKQPRKGPKTGGRG